MRRTSTINQLPQKRLYVQPGMKIVECRYAGIVCSSNANMNKVPDFEEGEELTW